MHLMIIAAEEAKLKCQMAELHFISNMLGGWPVEMWLM